jgi:hypothetical protein
MTNTLEIVVSWIDRQFGDRLSVDEQIALCGRMMRRYWVDPELYDNVSLWRLNDDATVAGEG